MLMLNLQILHLGVPKVHFNNWQHFDHVTMAEELNNVHIIYYHMDETQQVWHGIILLILTIWLSRVGSMPPFISGHDSPKRAMFINMLSFSGDGVGYTPLDTPCDHIVAIVNCFDVVCSFIITAYPAL